METPNRARIAYPRIALSIILALITTTSVAWSLAVWAPIEKGRPTISKDGDHLQLWLLRLDAPGASRTIWFEKGRVYGASSLGGPQGASSSAVSCWSFATAQRQHPKKTISPFQIPPQTAPLYDANPRTAWGAALDRRGWPFPAFESVIIGDMDNNATAVYRAETGVLLTPDSTGASRNSLADVRAIPLRPLVPGLLANTALYAGAWYAILLIPAAIITRLRRPRGHCPSCGYDLRGELAAGCPECGWNKQPQAA